MERLRRMHDVLGGTSREVDCQVWSPFLDARYAAIDA